MFKIRPYRFLYCFILGFLAYHYFGVWAIVLVTLASIDATFESRG